MITHEGVIGYPHDRKRSLHFGVPGPGRGRGSAARAGGAARA
jgi:hypothetical protein